MTETLPTLPNWEPDIRITAFPRYLVELHHPFARIASRTLPRGWPPTLLSKESWIDSEPQSMIGIPMRYFRFQPPFLTEGRTAYRIHRLQDRASDELCFELRGYDETLLGCLSSRNISWEDVPILGAVDPRVDRGVVIEWFVLPEIAVALRPKDLDDHSLVSTSPLFVDAILYPKETASLAATSDSDCCERSEPIQALSLR